MNNAANLIPPLDSFGIPAPSWVFVCLLNLTLVAHFLFLGYVFTTTLMGIFWSLAPEGSAAKWMLRKTERFLPVALSFAVTLGVAPLLFVQVLYHPYFYSANIMIGFQWFAIVPVLIFAFYMIYILNKGVLLGRRIPRLCEAAGRLAIFICILFVGVTHTTNALLAMNPDIWQQARAAGGTTFGLASLLPVFWPRLLHNLTALVVVGGIWMINQGVMSSRRLGEAPEASHARQLGKLGGLVAVGAIFLELIFGMWLFVGESKAVQNTLMMMSGFRPAAMLWMLALGTGLILLVMAALALAQIRSKWVFHSMGTVLILTLGGMFAGREAARQARLMQYFKMSDWPVHVQVSSLALFLATFIVALALVGIMCFWLRQAMFASAGKLAAPATVGEQA